MKHNFFRKPKERGKKPKPDKSESGDQESVGSRGHENDVDTNSRKLKKQKKRLSEARPKTRATVMFIVQLTGSIILLSAWVLDNISSKNSQSAKDKLELARTAENTICIQRDLYETEIMTMSGIIWTDTPIVKTVPALMTSFLHAERSYCDLVDAENYVARMAINEYTDSSDKPENDTILSIKFHQEKLKNDLLEQKRDSIGLHDLFGNKHYEDGFINTLVDSVNKYSLIESNNIKKYNTDFKAAYIVGSVLLALGLVLKFREDVWDDDE